MQSHARECNPFTWNVQSISSLEWLGFISHQLVVIYIKQIDVHFLRHPRLGIREIKIKNVINQAVIRNVMNGRGADLAHWCNIKRNSLMPRFSKVGVQAPFTMTLSIYLESSSSLKHKIWAKKICESCWYIFPFHVSY